VGKKNVRRRVPRTWPQRKNEKTPQFPPFLTIFTKSCRLWVVRRFESREWAKSQTIGGSRPGRARDRVQLAATNGEWSIRLSLSSHNGHIYPGARNKQYWDKRYWNTRDDMVPMGQRDTSWALLIFGIQTWLFSRPEAGILKIRPCGGKSNSRVARGLVRWNGPIYFARRAKSIQSTSGPGRPTVSHRLVRRICLRQRKEHYLIKVGAIWERLAS
jgi:hypothetical protein